MFGVSPANDLAGLYAHHMEHHGCGKGLFIPVSVADLSPPCCGFFDRNGDWNLIAELECSDRNTVQQNGFTSLTEPLRGVTSIDIKWQPKTSTGVSEDTVDTSAGTSTNVAGGADAHIKYTSRNKFGAVLMTMKPVVLKAFHQERVFMQWLEDNKHKLHKEYGSQLRRYGLWIITKTYSTHGASINAWYNDDKDVLVSIAAKANMLGELKGELNQSDKVMDKDWSHYFGNGPYTGSLDDERVVVFVDGIELKPSYWWFKSLEYNLSGSTKSKSPNPAITRIKSEELESAPLRPIAHIRNAESLSPPDHKQPQPRRHSDSRTSNLIDEKYYDLAPTTPDSKNPLFQSSSLPRQQALTPSPAPASAPAHTEDRNDDHVLTDAFGGHTSLSRAASTRHPSISRPPSFIGDSNNISPQSRLSAQARTPSRGSLRRDSRDVSEIRKGEQNRMSVVSYESTDKNRLSPISYHDAEHKVLSGVIRNVGTREYTGLGFQDHDS